MALRFIRGPLCANLLLLPRWEQLNSRASQHDEVFQAVIARPGGDLVALASAALVGIAFDGAEEARFGLRDESGMNPVGIGLAHEEDAARLHSARALVLAVEEVLLLALRRQLIAGHRAGNG